MTKKQINFQEYTNLCKTGAIVPVPFHLKTEDELLYEMKKGAEDIDLKLCEICYFNVMMPNKTIMKGYFTPNFNTLEKADYGGTEARIGEIRNYGGVEKQKQPDGTWVRYYGNEFKSGKINEEAYHKNIVSLKASKVKELLKTSPTKDIATANHLLSVSFHPIVDEIHQHHHPEVINKLIRDKVITGSPTHTNLSKLFSRTPVPAQKIQTQIEEVITKIPEGMKTTPISTLEADDKVKVKMSFGDYEAIIKKVNENGTADILIPAKRASVSGVALNKIISKFIDGEEHAVVKDVDIKVVRAPKEKVQGKEIEEEDDNTIKIEGDEELAEDAKRIGTSQVIGEEKPSIEIKAPEGEEIFEHENEDDSTIGDLIEDDDAGIDELNDFKLSPIFTSLPNKKDRKAINLAFSSWKTNKQLQKHANLLNSIIN